MKVTVEIASFLNYLKSVLESQYVTQFEDEDSDGQMREYVSLDIEYVEYQEILNKLEKYTKHPNCPSLKKDA